MVHGSDDLAWEGLVPVEFSQFLLTDGSDFMLPEVPEKPAWVQVVANAVLVLSEGQDHQARVSVTLGAAPPQEHAARWDRAVSVNVECTTGGLEFRTLMGHSIPCLRIAPGTWRLDIRSRGGEELRIVTGEDMIGVEEYVFALSPMHGASS